MQPLARDRVILKGALNDRTNSKIVSEPGLLLEARLHTVSTYIAPMPPASSLRKEYIARINRVMDYIERNLDRPLKLDELSRVANFSAFHFHRIFTAFTGETLNRFIQRVRIEKAATLLLTDPEASVTAIALDCGFSSSSTLARAFSAQYGMSASEWRSGGYRKICKAERKTGNANSKDRNDFDEFASYLECVHEEGARSNANAMQERRKLMIDTNQVTVEVKKLPTMHVAYVRHVGPYAGDEELFKGLIGRLMKWAGPRGLIKFPETKMLMVYHDNPEITDESKLRTSVCITVPRDTAVDGEIGSMDIPGGTYAIAHFEIGGDEYGEAWKYVYGQWLPDSGYQPDDRPCFEMPHNDPEDHPERKHIVDICVPVRPM
ncbi:MAG: helix-turn-helix domain-containing protein [Chitinivibrionales bacterium]|nr:helix-turn-helix domain-containing protein [Chitinivibrionales bacterium]